MTTDISGLEELVARLDHAVRCRTLDLVTTEVRNTLSELIRGGRIRLPKDVKTPCRDHYARRLLYRSPDHDYTVIAMIWGPRQGTPLHDHAGIWCVEGVLEGEIDVTQYGLLEEEEERFHFEPVGTVRAGIGTSGSLIPPFEYHTIANARKDSTSVTVHVYGKEMDHCTIFQGGRDGWYERRTKDLVYH
jgi:predicted metal-dependent enzyme (double-stranded beta helix superfamily)